MLMPTRIQLKYGLMLGANVVLFYFLYRWIESSIHWDAFKAAIVDTPFTAILSALIIGQIILCLYGQRLALLIDRDFGSSFWIVCYGFGANSVLPFRIGDALKIYFAKRYFNVSAARLLFIKVMEKFFDLTFLLVIGVLAFLFGVIAVDKTPLILITGFLVAIILFTIAAIVVIRHESNWISRFRKHGTIDHIFNMFEDAIVNPAKKKAIGISAIIWVSTVTMMYLFYILALPGFEIGWNDALALVFVTTISLGIPSAPGALGIFEAAIVFYLTKFVGVTPDKSLATALVLHLLIAGPQIVLMLTAIVIARQKLGKSRRLSTL